MKQDISMKFRHFFIIAAVVTLTLGIHIENSNADSFPDDDEESARFIGLTKGLSSLGEQGTNLQLEVSGSESNLELSIFDGDVGGVWDMRPASGSFDQSWFTLYADPLGTGNTTAANQITQWDGSSMPNDAWFNTNILNDSKALTASGEYSYNLSVTWKTNNNAHLQNAFKVDSNAEVLSFSGSRYGFVGHKFVLGAEDWYDTNTMYDGMWKFYLEIPEGLTELNLWNGDFDLISDTNDTNSPAFPPFDYPAITLAEGANRGVPADDTTSGFYRVEPNVYQSLTGPYPYYDWTVYDYDPSGNKEWELWKISTIDDGTQDVLVDSIPAGVYTWAMYGVDGHNTLYLRSDYPYGTTPPIPEPGTFALFGLGALGALLKRRKKK